MKRGARICGLTRPLYSKKSDPAIIGRWTVRRSDCLIAFLAAVRGATSGFRWKARSHYVYEPGQQQTSIAAGIMLAQFTKYLRNLPVDPDIQLDLVTSEITVSPS